MDVDTASYSVTRRYLRDGLLPPPESVRVEEFVNAFDYNYEPPWHEAFAIILKVHRPNLVKESDFNYCESVSKDGWFQRRTGKMRY